MSKEQVKKHTIDAKGRVPGRVATEVAVLLMGKNRTDFVRNRIPNIEVEVIAASLMSINAKRLREKEYFTHSGFPGNLRRESAGQVASAKGSKEVLRRAVYGMLPKNKLRAKMMNNLKIKD